MGSIDRNDGTPQLLNRLRMRQVALILAIDEHRTLRAAAGAAGASPRNPFTHSPYPCGRARVAHSARGTRYG